MACEKMRLVLGHFLSCPRLQQSPKNITKSPSAASTGCSLCSQLIALVVQHARHLCQAGGRGCCPVPMCDAIRSEIREEELTRRKSEESPLNNNNFNVNGKTPVV